MKFIFLTLICITLTGRAHSEGLNLSVADIEYGKYLSGECVTCHHTKALNTEIPSISGLEPNIFVSLMLAYKSKEIEHPIMQMIAERLSEDQIISLAVYFSKLNRQN